MPKLHPSWTADDSPDGPLALLHDRVDELVGELQHAGAGTRDEVAALASARDIMRGRRGWARDEAFLALLEDVLDDVYDVVIAAAPVWSPGNASDCHVQAYSLLVFLRAWHAASADKHGADTKRRAGVMLERRDHGCRGRR